MMNKRKNCIKMNLNVISQLLTVFMVVSAGPVIAYLAFKTL
jgi:hypothetical protein